ncbi:two-partner secretion domain-containing protein, partial [Comamonas composti]|uniref:two-partner secretion domain-containing protein n=1 Tax=Comamonas composti TaxID=408558 RepID=UPI00047A2AD4
MNHIFSSLWNHSLGAWVAASEHTRRGRQRGGSASRSRGRKASAPQMTIGALQAAVLLACGWLLTAGTQATAQSLPQNGNIVSGSASINFNGNVMTIDQTSRAALINWSSFNIGAANTVQFNQLQGSQATAVNLVTGSSASLISGELTSIGQVFLINPAGITFNAGASVNVGGLLASTLSPGTPGLLNANGVASTFELAGGGTGAVVSNNGGTLSAASGGISLIGGAVSNIGIISAANGSINLVAAGAARVTNDVSSSGMSQLTFLPTAAGTFAGTGINNTGVLSARNISMNALMGPGLSSTGINTGGTIIANAIDAGEGSLTIRSTAPVAINAATITAETVAVAGVGASGPVAIQMTDGSIQAGTVAFDSGPSGNVMLGGDIKADTIGIAANNAVQTGGSLEGALSLATQGGVILGQSGNRIGSVGGSVGSDLTLATSTDLSNGGALSVGGSSVIEAGSANITLTNAGNSFGNGVSANGGDITLVSNGVLGLGNINARSLAAQAGSIDLSGTVTTTGDQTYQSAVTLRGNSALQGRAIQFNDTIDGSYRLAVDSSGMTTFSGAVGGSTALQALNVTSGTGTRLAGDITTSGAIDLQDNLLLGTNVALTSTGNQGITLGGSVDSTGGARSLTLTTNGLATLGGSVGGSSALSSLQRTGTGSTQLGGSITTTGDIVLQGGLQATGSTAISSTGNGRIDVGGSILANGGVALSGGDIIVGGDISAASAASVGIDGATFSGAGITSNGTLDINVRNGALLQNGAYLAGGTASFSVAGDIVLTNAQNQLGGTVSLHGEDVTLANQGNLRLGSVDAQTLQVNSTGSISQTNNTHLDVTGTSSFTSTGGISLLDTGNALAGAVSLSGGAAQITASGDLRFGALNVDSLIASADTVYLPQLLTTLGGQSYSGRLVLEGDTALSSTLGALAFTGTLEGPHALSLHASGTVSLGATADIGSLGSTATETQLAADLTTVGDISLANTRVVGDVALTSTAGSVQINGVVNGLQDNSDSLSIAADGQIALLGAVGNAERLHDLSLSAATVSTVAVDVGNRLAIDSTASINQGGRYGVGGTARFASGGDITLLNTANAFGGDVELIGNKVQIAAQGPLSLSGVDADVLHATAGGLLTVRNADVVSSTTLTGNAVALDGVALGLSAEVAALGGNITQQGSVRVDGPSSWSSSGNVLLGNAANQLDGAVTAQGNMVSLATDGTLDIASVQASGQANLRGEGVHLDSVQATGLQVDSSAGITQGSALNVGGSSRFSAAGDIALGHAGNQFGGSVALNGANVAIASASGLLLDTVQASGDLSVAAGNAGIRQNAA